MRRSTASDPACAGRGRKRGYTLDLYRRRADLLREVVSDIELGSDWIVGFCGETEADFAGSEALLEELGFAVNYIFKYDPRPTTHAAERLVDDLAESVKKDRNRRLLALAERVQAAIAVLRGRTVHGVPVSFRGEEALVGTMVELAIDGTTAYGMAGRVPEPVGR